MSGVKVDAGCVSEWNNMKLKHMYTYITFRVDDEMNIVVDKKGKETYQEFRKTCLAINQCRYAVVEVPGTTKIVFILWAPEAAITKDKMIYASSRQGKVYPTSRIRAALLDKLSGYSKTLQASDLSDIDESKVKNSV